MDEKRRKVDFIINFIYCCIIIFLIILAIKYLLSPLLPFITAFIIVTMSGKIISAITKGRLTRKGASAIFTILVIAVLSLTIFGISYSIFNELTALSDFLTEDKISQFSDSTKEFIQSLSTRFSSLPFIGRIAAGLTKSLTGLDESLLEITTKYIPSAISAGMKFLSFFPAAVIFLTLMFISIYYISCDYEEICAFLSLQMPKRFSEQFYEAKDTFLLTAKQLFKAYFVLTFITFCQLLSGFLIMKINYAVLLALIISIVDLIPILGTGTVLIPWSIICFISGEYRTATGLIILYVIIALFRRIAEPKIVGANIGLSPLLSLISIYVGLKTASIYGIIIFPLITITVISLNEKGLIHLYRSMPENAEKQLEKTKRKFIDFKKQDNS